MTEPVGWGVLAAGGIAHGLVRDLALVPEARLAAVGSRDLGRAREFAEEHRDAGRGSPPAAHGSYADLVADPAVEVVYVASPHALHLEHARLALEAGKHVLCEKPLTLDLATAQEMVDLARRHDRFLMEAMWTACHPVVRTVVDQLAAGRFGTPRRLAAELGFRVDAPAESRMLDPALGASALLDMGVYPLTFAHLLFGEPERLTAAATLSSRGIDLDVAIAGRYAGGVLASLSASMTSWSSRTAALATDEGRLVLEDFHHPSHATFTPHGPDGPGTPLRIDASVPVVGRGYAHEVAEVCRCVRAGLRESPLVPHAQTLSVMGQLDDVRRQMGVRFG